MKENYPKIDINEKLEKKPVKKKIARNICPICNKKGTIVKDESLIIDKMIEGERILIPNLKGVKCNNCNFTALDEKSTEITEEIFIKSKIPLASFKRKIAKSGKSLVVNIPKDIIESMSLHKEMNVNIYPRNYKSIVIEFSE